MGNKIKDNDTLLKQWDLSELIERFKSGRVTLRTLNVWEPNAKSIEELIPEVGLRDIFIDCLKKYREARSDNQGQIDNNHVEIHDAIIEINNTQIQPGNSSYENNTNSNSDYLDGRNSRNIHELINNLDLEKVLDCASGIEVTECYNLKGFLDPAATQKLLTLVTDYLLSPIAHKPRRFYQCSLNEYDSVADKIIAKFPKLNKRAFYTPPKTISPDQKSPKGKLVDFYKKRLGGFRAYKLIAAKRKKDECPIPKKKRKRNNQVNKELPVQPTDEAQTSHDLLKNDPPDCWSEIKKHWIKSTPLRLTEVNNLSPEEILNYYNQYDCVSKPNGTELLKKDYDLLFDNSDNLYKNWPTISTKLKALMKNRQKTSGLRAPLYREYLSYLDSEECSDDSRNAILLSLIPVLLPQNKRFEVPLRRRTWKPSTSESIEGFMFHVELPLNVDSEIDKKIKFLKAKGLDYQPTVVIVGPTLYDINQVFVTIDKKKFPAKNVLDALDTCYKVIHLLNLDYAKESEPTWLFVQRNIYNLKFDNDDYIGQLDPLELDLHSTVVDDI